MRAKFRCSNITDYGPSQITANLSAVTDDATPENERYNAATPSGTLALTITNPAVRDFFTVGKSYYLDFTEADA
jgi:hypothetical protein